MHRLSTGGPTSTRRMSRDNLWSAAIAVEVIAGANSRNKVVSIRGRSRTEIEVRIRSELPGL